MSTRFGNRQSHTRFARGDVHATCHVSRCPFCMPKLAIRVRGNGTTCVLFALRKKCQRTAAFRVVTFTIRCAGIGGAAEDAEPKPGRLWRRRAGEVESSLGHDELQGGGGDLQLYLLVCMSALEKDILACRHSRQRLVCQKAGMRSLSVSLRHCNMCNVGRGAGCWYTGAPCSPLVRTTYRMKCLWKAQRRLSFRCAVTVPPDRKPIANRGKRRWGASSRRSRPGKH